ncbi:MAG TPA: UDP-2,3-diacylglucosamine diphosphatase, partial [Flavisolibacter sp.]|nr:UDP-2,3-diacylglucosamine diphosphatase [Flavisolibacter sp.]
IYSREVLKQETFNFFVFGHRHLPIDFRLSTESRYINLGEWLNFQTYAVFDGSNMVLKSFTGKEEKIYRSL